MNTVLKALLVDDEANNNDNLALLLQAHCPGVQVAGTALSAAEAREKISALRPDLLFLDIRMPGENGFDLLQSLPDIFFEVIFVTAYDQYGIQAIKFSALDYLLKPINTTELKAAVDKATQRIAGRQRHLLLDNMLELFRHQHQRDRHKLALPVSGEVLLVKPEEIMYCVASNTYTTFHNRQGEKILVSRPIREYEELLQPYGFLRVHQSYLVNREYIRSFSRREGYALVLDNGMQIPVSRQKKEWVQEQLGL